MSENNMDKFDRLIEAIKEKGKNIIDLDLMN